MDPFVVHAGRAVPLRRSDIDTDQIIPSDWLKRVERTGFGAGLFGEWRTDPDFVLEQPQHAGASVLVTGENFGTGSSREHAALAPLQLGVKAVFAKSFARIHRRNLVAQGILAFTFKDDADYDRAEVGQVWRLPRVREELADGADEITVEVEDGDDFEVTHDLAPKEREILVEGGLLHWLEEHGERAQ